MWGDHFRAGGRRERAHRANVVKRPRQHHQDRARMPNNRQGPLRRGVQDGPRQAIQRRRQRRGAEAIHRAERILVRLLFRGGRAVGFQDAGEVSNKFHFYFSTPM